MTDHWITEDVWEKATDQRPMSERLHHALTAARRGLTTVLLGEGVTVTIQPLTQTRDQALDHARTTLSRDRSPAAATPRGIGG